VILVDSSVWIEYFNGKKNPHTDYLDEILGSELVGIGDLMLTEVFQGFRSDAAYKTAKSLLIDLPIFEIIGQERAIKAAENYRFLRKKGITVRKTVDNMIATFCIDQQLPLLFADKDFDPFVKHLGLQSALSGT
jgi:predicted nucleic acid-binding protein